MGGGGGSAGHRDSVLLKLFRSEIHNGLYITKLTCTGTVNQLTFIEEFYYNALGAFFDALIQRTDGCLDVP